MDASNAERAELFLCLARAFAAPLQPGRYEALAAFLAEDLALSVCRLDYPALRAVEHFRVCMREVPDGVALLQAYAKLFLTPPAPVKINTGRYLDGAIRGRCELALEEIYRRHGLARAEGFHDLADHVSVQLEFVACLFSRAAGATEPSEASALGDKARRFLVGFPQRWLPRFCADLRAAVGEHGVGGPYLHLAQVLKIVVTCETGGHSGRHGVAPGSRARKAFRSAETAPSAAQLVRIAAALKAHGLATDHLGIPLESRDDAMGLSRVTGGATGATAHAGNCARD